MQVIIDHGTDVNVTNKCNCTALMMASKSGNVDVMNMFIKAGDNRDIRYAENNTWLHYAASGVCSKDIRQEIISHGADVNATSNLLHTPLMYTCVRGKVVAMKVFLRAGANPNISDAVGFPLVISAAAGCVSENTTSNLNEENKLKMRSVSELMKTANMGNEDMLLKVIENNY